MPIPSIRVNVRSFEEVRSSFSALNRYLDDNFPATSIFIDTSSGSGSAGLPILLDTSGTIAANMIDDSTIDHGSLAGTADDDHTQYSLADGTRSFTGQVTISSGGLDVTGDILVTGEVDGRTISDDARFLDGATLQSPDIVVVEDGGAVKLQIQKFGGGDLTFYFAGVDYILDCTPVLELTLTQGSDTVPQLNYVYVTESGGTLTLTLSTSAWPTTSFAPIAKVQVQTAASVATDGAMSVHAWTDHIYSATENGMLSHLNRKLRSGPATWDSGIAASALSISNPNAYIATASGKALQLHIHSFPARDMQTGDPLFVANEPTTPFNRITSLASITQDAEGTTWGTNKFGILVIWGSISQKQADSKLMCNLPSGLYNTEANAIADDNNTANYSLPASFTGIEFLIAAYVVKKTASGWTESALKDLRGQLPSTAASGGAITDHGNLAGLTDDDHAQYHNDSRGDDRYYTETELDAGQLDSRYFTEAEHASISAGAPSSGLPIKLDSGGKIDASFIDDSDIDHGSIGGLTDDDHTQYYIGSLGSTDNVVMRTNGTGARTGQSSGVTISDTNEIESISGDLTVNAVSGSTTIVGLVGDTELGDGTLRVLRPNTDLKMDFGIVSKRINDCWVGGRMFIPISTANLSSPPTDAELDTEFGTPTAGFIAWNDDNGAGTSFRLIGSDGTSWFFSPTVLTKAT